mmetsp:Transcript_114441/g.355382  ORF Transcript_114441/g.355382 Transcript_114441/m.355382 type:complete len:970 (-) Transcript_114441:355-3264(-)
MPAAMAAALPTSAWLEGTAALQRTTNPVQKEQAGMLDPPAARRPSRLGAPSGLGGSCQSLDEELQRFLEESGSEAEQPKAAAVDREAASTGAPAAASRGPGWGWGREADAAFLKFLADDDSDAGSNGGPPRCRGGAEDAVEEAAALLTGGPAAGTAHEVGSVGPLTTATADGGLEACAPLVNGTRAPGCALGGPVALQLPVPAVVWADTDDEPAILGTLEMEQPASGARTPCSACSGSPVIPLWGIACSSAAISDVGSAPPSPAPAGPAGPKLPVVSPRVGFGSRPSSCTGSSQRSLSLSSQPSLHATSLRSSSSARSPPSGRGVPVCGSSASEISSLSSRNAVGRSSAALSMADSRRRVGRSRSPSPQRQFIQRCLSWSDGPDSSVHSSSLPPSVNSSRSASVERGLGKVFDAGQLTMAIAAPAAAAARQVPQGDSWTASETDCSYSAFSEEPDLEGRRADLAASEGRSWWQGGSKPLPRPGNIRQRNTPDFKAPSAIPAVAEHRTGRLDGPTSTRGNGAMGASDNGLGVMRSSGNGHSQGQTCSVGIQVNMPVDAAVQCDLGSWECAGAACAPQVPPCSPDPAVASTPGWPGASLRGCPCQRPSPSDALGPAPLASAFQSCKEGPAAQYPYILGPDPDAGPAAGTAVAPPRPAERSLGANAAQASRGKVRALDDSTSPLLAALSAASEVFCEQVQATLHSVALLDRILHLQHQELAARAACEPWAAAHGQDGTEPMLQCRPVPAPTSAGEGAPWSQVACVAPGTKSPEAGHGASHPQHFVLAPDDAEPHETEALYNAHTSVWCSPQLQPSEPAGAKQPAWAAQLAVCGVSDVKKQQGGARPGATGSVAPQQKLEVPCAALDPETKGGDMERVLKVSMRDDTRRLSIVLPSGHGAAQLLASIHSLVQRSFGPQAEGVSPTLAFPCQGVEGSGLRELTEATVEDFLRSSEGSSLRLFAGDLRPLPALFA